MRDGCGDACDSLPPNAIFPITGLVNSRRRHTGIFLSSHRHPLVMLSLSGRSDRHYEVEDAILLNQRPQPPRVRKTALGVHYTRSRELRDTQQRAGYQLTGDELEPQLRAALICADDAGDAGVKRPWSSASLNQGSARTDWTPPPVGALSWANSPPVLPTHCCTPVCSSLAFEHQFPGAPLPQWRGPLCSNNLIPPS
ncbi:hypothetical protein K438DRAFT_1763001 [Mycena galopus ATCC 62051]|nr:hypothetical protein K438DRAFT_1763001 [Mycena galopus ATCC 62051]